MLDVKINIYYVDRTLIDSFYVKTPNDIKTIHDASILVIDNLGEIYKDIRYKINIFKPSSSPETIISLYFDEDITLKRDFTIRKILE